MLKTILIFLTPFLIVSISFAQDGVTVAKNTFPFTVSIVMQDQFKKPLSLGSGFIIGPGKVVTNVHVIEGAHYGDVIEDKSGITHKIAGYTAIDKKNDLILLSIPTLNSNGLMLSDSIPEVGQKIFAIGNPKGLSGTISEGIISGIRILENNNLYQITAPISPGSSGGPVLNTKGNVIGVSVASLTSGQNLNFAIPAKYVKNLINSDKNLLTKLNIVKPVVKTTVVSPKEGVIISDITWKSVTGQYPQYFDQYLKSFSITNLTENTICYIEITAIVYKNNLPIDYYEYVMFPNSEYGNEDLGYGPIKPFLGKSITLENHTSWNIRCRSKNDFLFNKNMDEKVVFRILNYTIIKD